MSRNGVNTLDNAFTAGDDICITTELMEPEAKSLSMALSKDKACILDRASTYYKKIKGMDRDMLDIGCDDNAWNAIAAREKHSTPIRSLLKSRIEDCSNDDQSNCYKVCWDTSGISFKSDIMIDLVGRIGLDNPDTFRYFISTTPTSFSSESMYQKFNKIFTVEPFNAVVQNQVSDIVPTHIIDKEANFSNEEMFLVVASLASALVVIAIVVLLSCCNPRRARHLPKETFVRRNAYRIEGL